MADEQYTFTQARSRLEEIVTQVRRKDVSLEKSLDLLEEGVRLANSCTELIDHTEWRTVAAEQAGLAAGLETPDADGAEELADAGAEGTAEVDDVETSDAGNAVVLVAVEEISASEELLEVAIVDVEDDGTTIVEVAEFETFADADAAWPDEFTGDEPAESPFDEPEGS